MTLKELITTKPIKFALEGGSPEEHIKAIKNIEKLLNDGKNEELIIDMLNGKAIQLTMEKYWELIDLLEKAIVKERMNRINTPEEENHYFYEIVDKDGKYWEWKNEESSICCMGRHNENEDVTNE